MLESVLQDVRFGVRILSKHRGVTIAAVLSLSLAMGACTAAFSLVDTLLLRPLPVREPNRLFYLTYSNQSHGTSAALFESLREAGSRYIEIFGYNWGSTAVAFDDGGGEEEDVEIQSFSGNATPILGLRPALGRVLSAADDRRPVAVLSYLYWTRRFGGNPWVLGRWFTWRGTSYQIVGVAQKGFNGLFRGFQKDIWISDSGRGFEMVLGHLRAGVGAEQARQVLQTALTNYRREQAPEFQGARLDFRPAGDVPTVLRTRWQRPLWVLSLVAGLVLLIACSNVANLLVARGAGREREMAMRISIGASGGRLIQQVLIESALLGCASCALGLALAPVMAGVIVRLMSASNSTLIEPAQIDVRIVPFLVALAALTTAIFGLAPALRASAVSPQRILKYGGLQQSGRLGLVRPILGMQVAVSFMVLFISGLLLVSFQRLMHVDLGFAKRGVILADVESRIRGAGQRRGSGLALLESVRQMPGVLAAGMSDCPLVGRRITTATVRFPWQGRQIVNVLDLKITPGFLDAMQIRLVEGRDLSLQDVASESSVVLVNEAFVRTYLRGQNPLGTRFVRADSPWVALEIAGVAGDTKYDSLREPSEPMIFEPLLDVSGTLVLRTTGNPLMLTGELRAEMKRVHPALRVTRMKLLSTRIDETSIRERLLALIAAFFGVLALLLAGVGVYGVLSYSVVRRTKEIGIRVALGARSSGIVLLITRDVAIVMASGVVIGAAGGFGLSRLVGSLLFEVKPLDLGSSAMPVASLFFASTIAAVRPALRAARLEPTVALCEE